MLVNVASGAAGFSMRLTGTRETSVVIVETPVLPEATLLTVETGRVARVATLPVGVLVIGARYSSGIATQWFD